MATVADVVASPIMVRVVPNPGMDLPTKIYSLYPQDNLGRLYHDYCRNPEVGDMCSTTGPDAPLGNYLVFCLGEPHPHGLDRIFLNNVDCIADHGIIQPSDPLPILYSRVVPAI